MKRRFFAMFLASGLVMGLCGCGSRTVSADDYEAQVEQEKPPIQAGDALISGPTESTIDTMPAGRCLDDYPVDKLIDMLSSGEITMADIESNVATGDVSYEDYEEILEYFPYELEPEQDVGKMETGGLLEEPIANVNLANYMSTYVWEYEDFNGYRLRETINLSSIFSDTDDDTADMYALWETLGGTVDEIPSKDELCEMSHHLREYQSTGHLSGVKYIIGTRTVENLTDDFPITVDNPYVVNNEITIDGTIDNPDEDANAKYAVTRNATTLLFYDSGRKCEVTVSAGIPLGGAEMISDTWGPVRFIIILPNDVTPNQPNGFAYDSLQYMFGPHSELVQNKVNFRLHNWLN